MECKFCLSSGLPNTIENTILYESKHFYVVPTVGQFVEGWLLIVSKHHYNSSITLPNQLIIELEKVIDVVVQAVEKEYGQTIIFEHGPSRDCIIEGGCSINHNHIHILPFKQLNKLNKMIDYPYITVNSIQEARKIVPINNGYLIWGSGSKINELNLAILQYNIPRQYMRKLIADCSGLSESWDWENHPYVKNIIATINQFQTKSHTAHMLP